MLLFLTGYRGTGKTTVARLLAEQLKVEWIDADDEIETRAGKTIAQIFADEGEPTFRDLEEQVVADLCKIKQSVISLGGGAILRQSTRERLKKAGPVVWLTASAETLAKRIGSDTSTADRRPNLTEAASLLEEVQQGLQTRTLLYRECATLAIGTEEATPQQIVEAIAAWLKNHSTI